MNKRQKGVILLKTTDNYGLKKPEATDSYNVDDFNENADKIDELLKQFYERKATLESLGLVKLSDSEAVTDSTGLALPATEKNATIEGTLANQISKLNTDFDVYKAYKISSKESDQKDYIIFDIPKNTPCMLIVGKRGYHSYINASIYLVGGDIEVYSYNVTLIDGCTEISSISYDINNYQMKITFTVVGNYIASLIPLWFWY